MLTVFRSNRAGFLARLLAQQLRLDPPSPFETVQVVVNTWPTSRWLGEQLALELGGIAANLRFPFPGSRLRQLVDELLGEPARESDPWRAAELVWPVLELLPALVDTEEAVLLRRWLERRGHRGELDAPLWQLGRAIADAFDDLSLYRPRMVAAWWAGDGHDGRGEALPALQRWQPLLFARLRDRLGVSPFGLRVLEATARLRRGEVTTAALGGPLRLFGLSSMAPVQVELLQALAAVMPVDLYLLTPCRDLWQRCGSRRQRLSDAIALEQPFGLDWLEDSAGMEASFGRLGGEFQQLLEGTGEASLGWEQERDLFFLPAAAATGAGRDPSLLEQLQEHLVDPGASVIPSLREGDDSIEFHPCPGQLRQVQIVRDRLLQLMAADPGLEPRDVLVMTPQVDLLAPLVASVFADNGATGVELPWRLTDRSQQSEPGIAAALLQILRLGGERLSASALETLLENPALQRQFQLEGREAADLTTALQRGGFRWGLEAADRGDDGTHGLGWAIDRLLLGLVLPERRGLAVAGCAPDPLAGSIDRQGRWLRLLTSLRRTFADLGESRTAAAWGMVLPELMTRLFGDGAERSWELQAIREAILAWRRSAAACPMRIGAPVVAAVLEERLAAESGRFGHRSGALTISALEPMRAIPHRVIVLMGLDAGAFPRQRQRPGFHLMERRRLLGDPDPADQDRYVLIEALLSARDHLLITWNCRDERSGEPLPPAAPVRQWLDQLAGDLGEAAEERLVVNHAANPLDRRNFLPMGDRPPASCDRRLLAARRLLEAEESQPPQLLPLALRPLPTAPPAAEIPGPEDPFSDLRDWLVAPQTRWLAELGLRPGERSEPVDDLEPLELGELQRSALLRERLRDPSACPDWETLTTGRGLLPAGSGGVLESRVLSQRWTSLERLLAVFGEPRQEPLAWAPSGAEGPRFEAVLQWRGNALVLLHSATPRPGHRLELWLQALLAAAAGTPPEVAVLVGRDKDTFQEAERLRPTETGAAIEALERLIGWRREYRHRCWPVPPRMGLEYALAERKTPGSGDGKASEAWQGGYGGMAEREQPEMALCFGACPATDLLEGRFGPFRELACALHGPRLEALG